MAFKMNKNNVNFGEGTGSSPQKNLSSFFGGDNVATPNDGSNMGNMIGNLLAKSRAHNEEAARKRGVRTGDRIDIPVDGGSDTVGGGNKQYASGFGPEGGDNNQVQSLLQGIQNILQGGGA